MEKSINVEKDEKLFFNKLVLLFESFERCHKNEAQIAADDLLFAFESCKKRGGHSCQVLSSLYLKAHKLRVLVENEEKHREHLQNELFKIATKIEKKQKKNESYVGIQLGGRKTRKTKRSRALVMNAALLRRNL